MRLWQMLHARSYVTTTLLRAHAAPLNTRTSPLNTCLTPDSKPLSLLPGLPNSPKLSQALKILHELDPGCLRLLHAQPLSGPLACAEDKIGCMRWADI
jgi:hypothetical protein